MQSLWKYERDPGVYVDEGRRFAIRREFHGGVEVYAVHRVTGWTAAGVRFSEAVVLTGRRLEEAQGLAEALGRADAIR